MTKRLESLGLTRIRRPLETMEPGERYRLEKISRGLRLPRHLYDALFSLAEELGVSKNLLMEFALQDFVNLFDADPEFKTPLFKMTFEKRLAVSEAKMKNLFKEMNIKRNSGDKMTFRVSEKMFPRKKPSQ